MDITGVNDLLRISTMQVTNANSGRIPVLRLRGGGADTKRKEARKRIFGQRESGPSPCQLVAEMSPQGAKLDIRPRKKQTKDTICLHSSEPGRITDSEDVSHGTELDQSSNIQEESPKSQRFIVFIGTQRLQLCGK